MMNILRLPALLFATVLVHACRAQTFMSNWPQPDNTVGCIAYDPVTDLVFISGTFTSVGGQPRSGLASIQASTGTLTPWAPAIGLGGVSSMVVLGNRLYVGGTFEQVEGVSRLHLASFDLPSGDLNASWVPFADGNVWSMTANTTTIYIAGDFTSVCGQIKYSVAALNATGSGQPTSFDAGYCDDWGYAIALSGNTVFLGGRFGSIGGQGRGHIAALNGTTGAVLPDWHPSANDYIHDLAVDGNTLYAAGDQSTLGGEYSSGVGAVDVTTGVGVSWDPELYDHAHAVDAVGDRVYVGGPFQYCGSDQRNGFAEIDANTGLSNAWNPDLANGPNPLFIGDILVQPPYLFVGGDFLTVGGTTHNYFAAFSGIASGIAETAQAPALNAFPNPTDGTLQIQMNDPRARTISISNALGGRGSGSTLHPHRRPGQIAKWPLYPFRT